MHKWEAFKLQARQYFLTKELHTAEISITYVIWSSPLKTSGQYTRWTKSRYTVYIILYTYFWPTLYMVSSKIENVH